MYKSVEDCYISALINVLSHYFYDCITSHISIRIIVSILSISTHIIIISTQMVRLYNYS